MDKCLDMSRQITIFYILYNIFITLSIISILLKIELTISKKSYKNNFRSLNLKEIIMEEKNNEDQNILSIFYGNGVYLISTTDANQVAKALSMAKIKHPNQKHQLLIMGESVIISFF